MKLQTRKMPPKKAAVPEVPVIFSFRFPVMENIPQPADGSTNYADILSSVETSQTIERFGTDMMKEVLSRTKSPTYNSHTACFWCCHPFSWKACVLPISYDAYENMYTCEGHYCSPECALAHLYAETCFSETARWTRHCLLLDVYRSLYKEREITPAPHRQLLRMFGGQLSIEQFRQYVATSQDMVGIVLPPLRLHLPNMNVQGPMRDVKKFVTLSQDRVEKANKELRLRRSKPVHTSTATLDKCMTTPVFGTSLPPSSHA